MIKLIRENKEEELKIISQIINLDRQNMSLKKSF